MMRGRIGAKPRSRPLLAKNSLSADCGAVDAHRGHFPEKAKLAMVAKRVQFDDERS